MRFIAPLLTLATMWLAAPMAHAWSPPPIDDAARLAAYLPIAQAAWPGSPCAGREAIHLKSDTALRAEAFSQTANATTMFDGMAAPTTCEVWMAADLDALTFCSVLVHEVGHLAGREHTTTPGDVMNGDGDVSWPACRDAVLPPPAVAAEQVRSALPAPRATWRIACSKGRAAGRRCVARRGTHVRKYTVTAAGQRLAVRPGR